jgi:hypothetical protein
MDAVRLTHDRDRPQWRALFFPEQLAPPHLAVGSRRQQRLLLVVKPRARRPRDARRAIDAVAMKTTPPQTST